MKTISLTRGKVAIIDDEDFDLVNTYKWLSDKRGYARASWPCQIYMHRLIMNAPEGVEVDHANGIKHDNRRSNLRFATHGQQSMNTDKQRTSKAPYKGIVRSRNKWTANIKKDGVAYNLGSYSQPWQAALAYDAEARKLFNEFARLNFPTLFVDECVLSHWQRADKTGAYPGVRYDKLKQRWRVEKYRNNKRIFARTFKTQEAAIAAAKEVDATSLSPE